MMATFHYEAMECKILKKIIGLATRIDLTFHFNSTTLKLAEKFYHPLFSHLFIFVYMFAQGHDFDVVTIASSKYFVTIH